MLTLLSLHCLTLLWTKSPCWPLRQFLLPSRSRHLKNPSRTTTSLRRHFFLPPIFSADLWRRLPLPPPCWIPIRLSTSGPPFLRPRSRRHLPRPSRRIRRGPRRSIPRGPRRPIRRGPAPALEPPRLCVLFGPSIRRYRSSRTRGTNTSRPRLLRPF